MKQFFLASGPPRLNRETHLREVFRRLQNATTSNIIPWTVIDALVPCSPIINHLFNRKTKWVVLVKMMVFAEAVHLDRVVGSLESAADLWQE
jgi:hypothetical protein